MKALLQVGLVLISLCAFAQQALKPEPLRITNGPVVENLGTSAATIAWSTNTSAGTLVRYGAQRDGLSLTKQAPWGGYTHRVELSGLQAGTKYYYRVESGHAQGTGATISSDIGEFTTLTHDGKPPAATAPKLTITSGPKVEHTTAESATISWTTNVSSSTVLRYGADDTKLTETAERPWGGNLHRIELVKLKPDTLYYFRVESAEGQGAEGQAHSDIKTFRTNVQSAARN